MYPARRGQDKVMSERAAGGDTDGGPSSGPLCLLSSPSAGRAVWARPTFLRFIKHFNGLVVRLRVVRCCGHFARNETRRRVIIVTSALVLGPGLELAGAVKRESHLCLFYRNQTEPTPG
jgi:hypothetical protein